MSTFICDKCNKIFNYKHHLTRHQNKKLSCVQNNNITITLPKPSNFTPDPPVTLPKPSNITPDPPVTLQDFIINKKQLSTDSLDNKKINNFECPNCKICFVRKDNLKRHIDKRCPKSKDIGDNLVDNKKIVIDTKLTTIIKQLDALKQDNNMLRDEIKKLKQTTINNTLNNQNVIIAHGSENFDKVKLETIMNHLSTVNFKDIIPNMTKHLYMNDENPEYKNFCVLDLSRDKCVINDGSKWIVAKTNKKIEKIFDNVHNVLTEPFEKENIHKTIEFIQKNPKKFNKKWIDYSIIYLNNLYDEDDKENVAKKIEIIEELKLIFFNNKDQIVKIKLDKNNA